MSVQREGRRGPSKAKYAPGPIADQVARANGEKDALRPLKRPEPGRPPARRPRLETRTEEPRAAASPREPPRRSERETPRARRAPAGVRGPSRGAWARKAVIYARRGRGRAKAWWRPAAVLTRKSLVGAGHGGERLIEPPGSWLPPKCLPGQPPPRSCGP